jgi:hypothetical protein
LLLRGTAIWALARLMVRALYMAIAAMADAETAAAFTHGNPAVLTGWTLALSVALVLVDLHRRREVTLLNNLGVFTSHAVMLGAVPAVVLESALVIF